MLEILNITKVTRLIGANKVQPGFYYVYKTEAGFLHDPVGPYGTAQGARIAAEMQAMVDQMKKKLPLC